MKMICYRLSFLLLLDYKIRFICGLYYNSFHSEAENDEGEEDEKKGCGKEEGTKQCKGRQGSNG